MSNREDIPCLLRAETIAATPERRHVHQFNENAVRMTRSLAEPLGLQRLGVHLVRLESGRDSTTFHFHEADEEFIYILEGRGVARIGEHETEVGAGDFMAFTAPSPAHALHNPFEEDLVYLVGGENNPVDVVRYPNDGWTLVKAHGQREGVRTDALTDV